MKQNQIISKRRPSKINGSTETFSFEEDFDIVTMELFGNGRFSTLSGFQSLAGESNQHFWLLILLVSDSTDYDVTLKSGKNYFIVLSFWYQHIKESFCITCQFPSGAWRPHSFLFTSRLNPKVNIPQIYSLSTVIKMNEIFNPLPPWNLQSFNQWWCERASNETPSGISSRPIT